MQIDILLICIETEEKMLIKIKNNFNTLVKVDHFLYISSFLIQLCVGLVLLYALYKIYINTPSDDIISKVKPFFQSKK